MRKDRVIIFGIGKYYEKHKMRLEKTYDIIGCTANIDTNKQNGSFIKVENLSNYSYDYILITSVYFIDIAMQLYNMGIECKKIRIDDEVLPLGKTDKVWIEEGKVYVEHNSGIKLHLSCYENAFCYHEVIKQNEYNFIVPEKDLIVMDIGMNIGSASLFFANKDNVKKVYGFEAVAETFKQAMVNIKLNPKLTSKIEALGFGIAKSKMDGEIPYAHNLSGEVSITHFSEINKSRKDNWNCTSEFKVESVEYLRKILNNHLDNKFVLKMDCEGAEYDIVEELNNMGMLNRFSVIMLEWHYEGDKKIIDILIENNFKVFSVNNNNDKLGLIYAVK